MLTRSIFFLQLGPEEVDSFVSAFGSFLKTLGSIVLEVPCKCIKLSVLSSNESGGDRIIVGRIEEGPATFSSADSPPSAFSIDRTPPDPAADVGSVGGQADGRNREGPGGGGNGPGGGGNGPGGGDDPSNGRPSDGDEENKEKRDELNKVAKISIIIAAQTATSLLSFPKEKVPTSVKYVLYMAVGMDLFAFIFCFTAVLLRRKKPLEASIMTFLGVSCSAFGFLLTLCLIVPPNFLWVVAVASIVLLSSVSILLISFI